MTTTIRVIQTVNASSDQAWRAFSDTDHLNRFLELPRVMQTEAANERTFEILASAKLFGKALKWREQPFEWVEKEWFRITRIYDEGPVRSVSMTLRFAPATETTTHLEFVARVESRSWVFALPIRLLANRVGGLFKRYCETFSANLSAGSVGPSPVRGDVVLDAQLLLAGLERAQVMSQAPDTLRFKLEEHLIMGGDDDVLHMRPLLLADKWQERRDKTLSMFLHATKAGLFGLEWRLMCPYCRVPKATAKKAGLMPFAYHCDMCGIDYDRDLDLYTEVQFSLAPEVRSTSEATYCLGSPARAPHILAQTHLKAKEVRTFTVEMTNEALRFRAFRSNLRQEITPKKDGPKKITFSFDGNGWRASSATFAPGKVEVVVQNQTDQEALIAIERRIWHPQALSAAELMRTQEFRDLFHDKGASEFSSVGTCEGVVVAIGLTDAANLYASVGDARAFDLFRQCMNALKQASGGGVVIREDEHSMMLLHVRALTAVDAAAQMLREFPAMAMRMGLGSVGLKIGMSKGPVSVIGAGEGVDYCGLTIERARQARDEGKVYEIALSNECADLVMFQAGSTLGKMGFDEVRREEQMTRLVVGMSGVARKEKSHGT